MTARMLIVVRMAIFEMLEGATSETSSIMHSLKGLIVSRG